MLVQQLWRHTDFILHRRTMINLTVECWFYWSLRLLHFYWFTLCFLDFYSLLQHGDEFLASEPNITTVPPPPFKKKHPSNLFAVFRFLMNVSAVCLQSPFQGFRYVTVVQSSGTASAAISNNGRSRTVSPLGGHAHLILHVSLRTRRAALLSLLRSF